MKKKVGMERSTSDTDSEVHENEAGGLKRLNGVSLIMRVSTWLTIGER